MNQSSLDLLSLQRIRENIQDDERCQQESARKQMRYQNYADALRHFDVLMEERATAHQLAQESRSERAAVVPHSFVEKRTEQPHEKDLRDSPATSEDVSLFLPTASHRDRMRSGGDRRSENVKQEEKTESKKNGTTRRKKQEKKQHISLENFLQPQVLIIKQPEYLTLALPQAKPEKNAKIATIPGDPKEKRQPANVEQNSKSKRENQLAGRAPQSSDLSPGESREKQISSISSRESNRSADPSHGKSRANQIAVSSSRKTTRLSRRALRSTDPSHGNHGKRISSRSEKGAPVWHQVSTSTSRPRDLFKNQSQKTQSIRKNTGISRQVKMEHQSHTQKDRTDKIEEKVLPNHLVAQFHDNPALLQTTSFSAKKPQESNMLAGAMTNFFQNPDEMVDQLLAAGTKGKSIQLRFDKLPETTITLSSQHQGMGVVLNIQAMTERAHAVIANNIGTLRKFFQDNLPFRPLKLKLSFVAENKRSPQNDNEEAVEMNAHASGTGSNNSEAPRLSSNMA